MRHKSNKLATCVLINFVLQIGDRSDSTVYIKSKVKAAEEVSQLFLDCLSFNPLHPNIINYILFSALHVFLMVLDGRI